MSTAAVASAFGAATMASASATAATTAGAHKAGMTAAAAAALDALALDLRLQPGIALGPFTLGIPLWHTLDYLRSNPAHFPKVSVVLPASPSRPGAERTRKGSGSSTTDTEAILISILPHLHLVFSAHSQRLQLITCNLLPALAWSGRDPSYRPVRLAYNRSLVFDTTPLLAATATAGSSSSTSSSTSSPSSSLPSLPLALTRTSIHQTFGPTYPPRAMPAQEEYVVSYPGLAFTFSSSLTKASSKGGGSATPTLAPLDKYAPASAFHIFAGQDLPRPAHVLLPPATAHMLPSYGATGSTTSRLGGGGLGSGAGTVASVANVATVPPACLKAVIRPGHSVTLHLFAHPPTQPLTLGPQTAQSSPSALLKALADEYGPAPSADHSPSSGALRRRSPSATDSATSPLSAAQPDTKKSKHKNEASGYPHGTRTLALLLGQTTTQDVLAELGAPQRRFEKVDERLGIHSFAVDGLGPGGALGAGGGGGVGASPGLGGVLRGAGGARRRATEGSTVELARRRMWKAAARADPELADFEEGAATEEMYENPVFWNYFDLGLDLLFASPALTPASVSSTAGSGGLASGAQTLSGAGGAGGAGGVLLKVIVHSNVAGSALFQRYHRCPWVVVPPSASASPFDEGREVSFHDKLDKLAALLQSCSSSGASGPTASASASASKSMTTTTGTATLDEERIELDRATDADFVPAHARSLGRVGGGPGASSGSASGSASSAASGAAGGGLGSAPGSASGPGSGKGSRTTTSTAAARADRGPASALKLDVRTWLYGFENASASASVSASKGMRAGEEGAAGEGVEGGEAEDDEVPEGGLIAEADEEGRVCSVLIY